MPYERFVAVGDSFTEGLHDGPADDGTFVGWADRVAHHLARAHPGLGYANLAVRGKLLDEVVEVQLPVAEALGPDLLSFHAGGNDVLRPGIDVVDVARRYDRAVERAVAGAGRVLLFTVLERSGPANRLADRLAGRLRRFNDEVRATAERHGATLVDLAAVEVLHDRRLWHEDRLHLAPHGHERVAGAVVEALGVAGTDAGVASWWRMPLPGPDAPSPMARAVDDARWFTRHFLPWVGRRLRGVSSGDGREPKRPELEPLDPR